MLLFGRREIIYQNPDRDAFRRARRMLKDAGIPIADAGRADIGLPIRG